MDDLISRQAAIDAIHGAIFDFFDICDDDEESPMTYKDEQLLEINKAISGRIKQLPSAQPERTCVNCGRTANNGGWYADGGTRCPIEEHYALPKDGFCHLWEKRNVTDDNYPERRTDE